MKYVIVTGATGAIGPEICKALAAEGYGLILACRDYHKAEALTRQLPKTTKVIFLQLDLTDVDKVHKAAAELPRLIPANDSVAGLINNAGVMASEYIISSSGHEIDMSVNYLNTRLWTRLILQSGLLSKGASIVFTTSLTRHLQRGTDMPKECSNPKRFSRLGTYGASKRALTFYAAALSRKLRPKGIYVNCADPGIVNSGMITMNRWFDPITDIIFRPFIRSPRKGAVPALRAFEAGLHKQSGLIFCMRRIHPLPSESPIELQ